METYSIYEIVHRMNQYAKNNDPSPIKSRNNRVDYLVNEFKNDPDLLNDVLIKLRKDKIEKIKNR